MWGLKSRFSNEGMKNYINYFQTTFTVQSLKKDVLKNLDVIGIAMIALLQSNFPGPVCREKVAK